MTPRGPSEMADLRRRSPLEHRALDLARIAAITAGAVQVSEMSLLSQINIRTADPVLLGLPTSPNTWENARNADALWLGPNEWLVVSAAVAESYADWERAGSVVDVSASRAVLEVSGQGARDLLAKGCALDLHPSKWTSGACAQTMLAKAPVILQQRSKTTRIFVRPSFADYLVEWFLAAST